MCVCVSAGKEGGGRNVNGQAVKRGGGGVGVGGGNARGKRVEWSRG